MKRKLNINKTVITVIGLNIVQISSILFLFAYSFFSDTVPAPAEKLFSSYLFLFLVMAAAVLNSFIAIRDSLALVHFDEQFTLVKESLAQVENLNHTLRAQRHDFLNHLQVVYGLMEMDEYKEAKDYIDLVYTDIHKVSNSLKTSHPAVNALLQAKMLACEKRGIHAVLKISSQLKDMKIPSWELCRVLGNIIDNSMAALLEKEYDKVVEVEIFEDLKHYGFVIQNNGPAIPAGDLEKIFEAGFTTKGDKGEGMGLYIARSILSENGGNLRVFSDESSTRFEGQIPKGCA